MGAIKNWRCNKCCRRGVDACLCLGATNWIGSDSLVVLGIFPTPTCAVTQVGFQHLTNVHAAWHAQWVEDDVDRSSVRHVWHVFDRQDLGDDTLVAVTASQLVSNGDFALLSDINTYELVDAWWQFVADFAVTLVA